MDMKKLVVVGLIVLTVLLLAVPAGARFGHFGLGLGFRGPFGLYGGAVPVPVPVPVPVSAAVPIPVTTPLYTPYSYGLYGPGC